MEAYIKYKAFYDKKPKPRNSKNNKIFTFYSLKQITKEAKFISKNYDG